MSNPPPELLPMRTQAEVQRAHDMLVGIILDEVPEEMRVSQENKMMFSGLASVLCWVLHHDHHKQFSNLLETIEKTCVELGSVIEKREPKEEP